MHKTILIFTGLAAIFVVVLTIVSCDQAHVRTVQMPVPAAESELEREIRLMMEKGGSLAERKRQVPAIAAAVARRTSDKRARKLAALCYLKTLGTPFMPLDLAEIALAETGGHKLSPKAVSERGALGVWQLMPERAKSHGFEPDEMANDEKCAEAAVRELASKLAMADGNLRRAKRYYCGVGKEADYYDTKIRQLRQELLDEMERLSPQRAAVPAGTSRS